MATFDTIDILIHSVRSTVSNALDGLNGLVKNVSSVSSPGVRASIVGGRERSMVRKADEYMAARLAGSTDKVLNLVSPDIRLTSSRDGTVAGIGAFRTYLGKTPPTGKWDNAHWNREKQRAEIRGLVKFVMVPVKVVAHFGFDRRGKINEIYVGTKKKEKR